MKLPKITSRERELLDLVYSYRFMTRSQIQVFIGHTDKRRISAWLKNLREKEYLDWIYDPKDFYAKTRPAVYHLGINGVRHYLELAREQGIHPVEEVRKRYREASRSRSYIDRCLLIADCCVTLRLVRDDKPDTWYAYDSEAFLIRRLKSFLLKRQLLFFLAIKSLAHLFDVIGFHNMLFRHNTPDASYSLAYLSTNLPVRGFSDAVTHQ
jgi:hypothetical protein